MATSATKETRSIKRLLRLYTEKSGHFNVCLSGLDADKLAEMAVRPQPPITFDDRDDEMLALS